ncbi:unnamed protein product [Medioppia subpectinata]|uniref:UBL3-like ubiquitin domain-containing protein n=1 Tax=Medioppia subpectinata TaxID=1979941 RepID=A0A7R9KDX7_9ACAR|nr:unnamed protein product [Medioppia subpectinata]CAG2101529.1 unnamed protein product [Medioppia subpectinata]
MSKWKDEAVSRAEILRLIFQGRFLHGNVTLEGIQPLPFPPHPCSPSGPPPLPPTPNLPFPLSPEKYVTHKMRGEKKVLAVRALQKF